MLSSEYIKINGVGYTPTSFDYSLQAVEEVGVSEAGTELVSITRLDKHIFNASWEGVTSSLLDAIEAFCLVPTVTLLFRSKSYTVRARGISPSLIGRSWKYRRSDGLWNVSITFTEI